MTKKNLIPTTEKGARRLILKFLSPSLQRPVGFSVESQILFPTRAAFVPSRIFLNSRTSSKHELMESLSRCCLGKGVEKQRIEEQITMIIRIILLLLLVF